MVKPSFEMQLLKDAYNFAKLAYPLVAPTQSSVGANFASDVLRTKPRDLAARWKSAWKKDVQTQRVRIEARQRLSLEFFRKTGYKQSPQYSNCFWETLNKNVWREQIRKAKLLRSAGKKEIFCFSLLPLAFNGKLLWSDEREAVEDRLINDLKDTCQQFSPKPAVEEDSLIIDDVRKVRFEKYISQGCEGAVYEVTESDEQESCDLSDDSSQLSDESSQVTDESSQVTDESTGVTDESTEVSDQNSFVMVDSNVESTDEDVTMDSVWSDFAIFPPAVQGIKDEVTECNQNRSTHPLACKVMYNFDTVSLATHIEFRFRNETLPLRLSGKFGDHPNIVRMHGAFSAPMPQRLVSLGAIEEFAVALPSSLYPEGAGRNMTHFVVMQRYDCSLSEYFREFGVPPAEVSAYLLLQVTQAISFLLENNVAHRDIKSDNLLLDLNTGHVPSLVVADFGLALDEGSLQIPFNSRYVCRGGTPAVMSPEIYEAVPGPKSVLDYRASDVWAAGLVGCQLLGATLPEPRSHPDHISFPDESPVALVQCIKSMLQRDPSQRITSDMASDWLCSWLWLRPDVTSSTTRLSAVCGVLAAGPEVTSSTTRLSAVCEVLAAEVLGRTLESPESLHHGRVARTAKLLFLRRLDLFRLRCALYKMNTCSAA